MSCEHTTYFGKSAKFCHFVMPSGQFGDVELSWVIFSSDFWLSRCLSRANGFSDVNKKLGTGNVSLCVVLDFAGYDFPFRLGSCGPLRYVVSPINRSPERTRVVSCILKGHVKISHKGICLFTALQDNNNKKKWNRNGSKFTRTP